MTPALNIVRVKYGCTSSILLDKNQPNTLRRCTPPANTSEWPNPPVWSSEGTQWGGPGQVSSMEHWWAGRLSVEKTRTELQNCWQVRPCEVYPALTLRKSLANPVAANQPRNSGPVQVTTAVRSATSRANRKLQLSKIHLMIDKVRKSGSVPTFNITIWPTVFSR